MTYSYELTSSTSIKRSDGAVIPADPANRDYAEYQSWVAAGNTPTPLPTLTLDEQKIDAIDQLKAVASSLLSSSDWMVIRKVDAGVEIPVAWQTYRDAVRAMSNTIETAIKASTTEAELTAAVSQQWPKSPSQAV